jgi:hypothetical protein
MDHRASTLREALHLVESGAADVAPAFDPEQIERWGRATDAMTAETPPDRLRAWRDRMVRAIRRLKQETPET